MEKTKAPRFHFIHFTTRCIFTVLALIETDTKIQTDNYYYKKVQKSAVIAKKCHLYTMQVRAVYFIKMLQIGI